MGFKISWIGFEGIGKAEVLERTGLCDSGEPDEFNEEAFSGADIPGGWFILFSNDFDFVSRERLALLSAGCRVVACQLHETVMVSAAYGYEQGHCIWALTHESDEGIDNLSVFKTPPPAFEAIRQRLIGEQEADVDNTVDYISDIPIEVAASVCNYRHDRTEFEWGTPAFTRLDAC